VDTFLGFEPGTAIVVTGAGSGIGRAIAETAARQGLRVAAWDLCAETAQQTADAITETGGQAITVVADVSDASAVRAAWALTSEWCGPVSCLACNAGPASYSSRALTEAVGIAIDCMRLPTEIWLEQPEPPSRAATYTASVQGPVYGAGTQWYTVAKSAVEGYMRSVASMRVGGIRANAILPDVTLTPRTEDSVNSVGGVEWDLNPMGRVGRSQDPANAAVFLLSPAAQYINGVSLILDGGIRLLSHHYARVRHRTDSHA
jgi:NAD(P)-dependent dehydrogenase (short-subunit alcohol dehydrogenase family)